ncbi:hypothetical protein [Colwellia psychrerythraea]|uniref:hypothetical protein n=1 Tax=Colwellia psychrerythraea TaxID=28229 RepID=UPI0012E03764|nr:hypothetical protein [Colwellia psychrerythraea]
MSTLLLTLAVSAGPKYGFKYVWMDVEIKTPIYENYIESRTSCYYNGYLFVSGFPAGNPTFQKYYNKAHTFDGIVSCPTSTYLHESELFSWYESGYDNNGNRISIWHNDWIYYTGNISLNSESVVSEEKTRIIGYDVIGTERRLVRVPCTSERDCDAGGPP